MPTIPRGHFWVKLPGSVRTQGMIAPDKGTKKMHTVYSRRNTRNCARHVYTGAGRKKIKRLVRSCRLIVRGSCRHMVVLIDILDAGTQDSIPKQNKQYRSSAAAHSPPSCFRALTMMSSKCFEPEWRLIPECITYHIPNEVLPGSYVLIANIAGDVSMLSVPVKGIGALSGTPITPLRKHQSNLNLLFLPFSLVFHFIPAGVRQPHLFRSSFRQCRKSHSGPCGIRAEEPILMPVVVYTRYPMDTAIGVN